MKFKIISLILLSAICICCTKTSSNNIENSQDSTSVDAVSGLKTNAASTTYSELTTSNPGVLRIELQNLINAAASKKQQLTLPAGKYVISDELLLPSNANVCGTGDRTIISLTSGNKTGRNVMRIVTRTNDVKLTHLTLDANQAANTGADLASLVVTDNINNLNFEYVTFLGGRDRGSVQIKGLNAYQVKNVTFYQCAFKEAGRTSLELRGTDKVLVKNCYFKNWGSQNPNSAAIQLQSQDNNNVQIIDNKFNNTFGKQFAIECAAAYVNDGVIADNDLLDPNNLGGNGISGYFKRTRITRNVLSGGNGNQRSGLEIFGQSNTVDYNEIEAGCIAISPGINEPGLSIVIDHNKVKTRGANVGGIQIGAGCCPISGVTVSNNVIDTRLSSGNSSGVVVGTYGRSQIVSNITVEANTIYTNAHSIRLQSLPGSKDIFLLRNSCKAGFTWLGVITNTFTNVKAIGNINETDNKNVSYGVVMTPIIVL